MASRIVFHIGLEKTGTDSFQRYCTENHRRLLGQGILYPVRGLAFAGRSHGPLAACYLPYRDPSVGPARARDEVLRSLRAQIERAQPATVLLSAEHFSSRFREAEIERLARDFDGHPCRIAVVVREHASRIHSAYAQWIAAGRSLGFEAYCDEIFDPASRYVRYRDTIEPWDRIFGRENLRVLSLAAGSNVIDQLRAALIPQAAGLPAGTSYRDNASPGASATAALRLVNLALPGLEQQRSGLAGRLEWWLLRIARRRIRALIAAAAGDRPQGRFRLSAANRARLQAIVDADRPWLEDRYGIRLDAAAEEGGPPPDEALARRLADQVLARPWVRFLAAMR